jgi:hypothetical protein
VSEARLLNRKKTMKHLFISPLLLFIAVLMISCSASVSPPNSTISQPSIAADKYQISEITYERSGSWGMRYGYKVILRKDGTAEYLGDIHAKRKGKYHSKIDAAKFEQLENLIVHENYFSRKDKYHSGLTDAETITTSVVYAGGRKTVKNFGGGGDDVVGEIERAIDSLVELTAWEKDQT